MEYAVCPYCEAESQITDDARREVEDFGKAVIECPHCKTLYLLRDDGDGDFVCR